MPSASRITLALLDPATGLVTGVASRSAPDGIPEVGENEIPVAQNFALPPGESRYDPVLRRFVTRVRVAELDADGLLTGFGWDDLHTDIYGARERPEGSPGFPVVPPDCDLVPGVYRWDALRGQFVPIKSAIASPQAMLVMDQLGAVARELAESGLPLPPRTRALVEWFTGPLPLPPAPEAPASDPTAEAG